MAFVTVEILDYETEGYVREHAAEFLELINEMLTAAWNPGNDDRVIKTERFNALVELSQNCRGLRITIATTNVSGLPALLESGTLTNVEVVNAWIEEMKRWKGYLALWSNMWQESTVFRYINVEFKPDNHERMWAAIFGGSSFHSWPDD